MLNCPADLGPFCQAARSRRRPFRRSRALPLSGTHVTADPPPAAPSGSARVVAAASARSGPTDPTLLACVSSFPLPLPSQPSVSFPFVLGAPSASLRLHVTAGPLPAVPPAPFRFCLPCGSSRRYLAHSDGAVHFATVSAHTHRPPSSPAASLHSKRLQPKFHPETLPSERHDTYRCAACLVAALHDPFTCPGRFTPAPSRTD